MLPLIFEDITAKAAWTYKDASLKSRMRAWMSDATLSMIFYRSMQFFNKYRVTRPFASVICKLNAIICGAVIGRGAVFGSDFVILHSVGIVINSKVRGGDHIIVESGVVIGEEKGACPVLGSHIFIGSGAKIFGGIKIGNNVDIGANAVVCKDIPDNVVVVGVPAKIIKEKR